MRITYVSHARFPTEKAHGHQIARVCHAMAEIGHEVTLVIPTVWNAIEKSAFEYYDIPENFAVTRIAHFDAQRSKLVPERFGFAVNMILYGSALRKYFSEHTADLLYVRSPMLLRPLHKSGLPVALELHSLPGRFRSRFVAQCNKCKRIIALTTPMRDQLVSLGVAESLIIVEGDAVDLAQFDGVPGQEEAKKSFGLPADRPVIGYAGRLKTLGMEKGVKHLLEVLASFKNAQRKCVGFIVGGPQKDVEEYQVTAEKLGLTDQDVLFAGHVEHGDIPRALAACDVLTMAFPDFPHYRTNMSPMKMFEYMAAERPIVTSDLPTVRDALDDTMAFFCVPGDRGSFAEAVAYVLDYPKEAAERAANARKQANWYTWENRMGRILAGL